MERDREETRKHYIEQFFELSKNEITEHLVHVIDCGYCTGYNTVLDACQKVLSKDDYQKVINWLEKHGY